jgi:hypothetical protein
MLRGLEGRRIAVAGDRGADEAAAALEKRGARAERLTAATSSENWHGGKYAALVITGAIADQGEAARAVQLLREFLVSDKPVAILGEGRQLLDQAGGVPEDAVLLDRDSEPRAFAERLAGELAARLDEREIDEMSDQSFPASDPPSTTPSSLGGPPGDDREDVRP